MGFLSNLFGGGGNTEEKFAKKFQKHLMNKFAQKEIRQDAMLRLAEAGTVDSILSLLQRFTINIPDTITDEKEKRTVVELLKAMGLEKTSQPMRTYLQNQKVTEIALVLMALEEIEGEEETKKVVMSLLQESDAGDAWTTERKLQLINHLDNYDSIENLEVLYPFLEDISDDVIFRTIDILDQVSSGDEIRNSFLAVLLDEDTSMRIRTRILEIVVEKNWLLAAERKDLEPLLPEGWFFTKRDQIKRQEHNR